MIKTIDFSCKHDILILSDDGTLQPMDEPYFRSRKIAPGTWQILSDGDYTYLVEGSGTALVIDSGYGCGNIREYCQSLTSRPVSCIANTHDHFDHTANNAYFDRAFMSAATYERRTLPFPSFLGIDFPRDYPVTIIGEGYVFQLGDRELETFTLKNHAAGSLAFLDRKNRVFFTGDEIGDGTRYGCNYSVEHCLRDLKKLYDLRGEYDRILTGGGVFDGSAVDAIYEALLYVMLHPEEGEPIAAPEVGRRAGTEPSSPIVYPRRGPRPCDIPAPGPANPNLRQLTHNGCTIVYDGTRIHEA